MNAPRVGSATAQLRETRSRPFLGDRKLGIRALGTLAAWIYAEPLSSSTDARFACTMTTHSDQCPEPCRRLVQRPPAVWNLNNNPTAGTDWDQGLRVQLEPPHTKRRSPTTVSSRDSLERRGEAIRRQKRRATATVPRCGISADEEARLATSPELKRSVDSFGTMGVERVRCSCTSAARTASCVHTRCIQRLYAAVSPSLTPLARAGYFDPNLPVGAIVERTV
jgi:hypothetical protein